MKLIKCKNGHIYDADKLASCPHCPGNITNIDNIFDTFGKNQENVSTEISDSENRDKLLRKGVGVLVITKGKSVGKAFVIYEGKNTIGREQNMDIPLINEDTVARNGHAVLTCSSSKTDVMNYNIFPTKNDRSVYINGKEIKGQECLKDRDVINIGEVELVLVTYGDVYL
ncbi:MAG: FHA domain-containing protein [Eubacterium sp.]|nr:FHA domain-containing protein [Eubacterium sp.]